MKRIAILTIPFITLVSVLLTFAMLEAQRKPDWKVELDRYITSKLPAETLTVKDVVVASHPENFNEAMGQPVRADWRWGVDELPYPPQALRCVLLERRNNSTGLTQRQVVFVGYHTDTLWRVGWLVHEGPEEPFTPEMTSRLVTLGCALSLE
jgi:hypothetical protein